MEISGKIKVIQETKEYGTSGFRKREVVIATDDQYPQMILIEFVQDDCVLLDSYKVDNQVKIDLSLLGREWTSPKGEVRYFNSFRANSIQLIESADTKGEATPFIAEDPKDEGDLPF